MNEWLQDDPPEVDVPPRLPPGGARELPVVSLEEFARRGVEAQLAADTFNGHTFELGEQVCRDCGVALAEAAQRRCGGS